LIYKNLALQAASFQSLGCIPQTVIPLVNSHIHVIDFQPIAVQFIEACQRLTNTINSAWLSSNSKPLYDHLTDSAIGAHHPGVPEIVNYLSRISAI